MNFNDEREMDHNSVFHERLNILKNQGYRGFSVTGGQEKWSGVELISTNSSGKKLKASGETETEAYENMIELIDRTLDE